MENDKWYLTLNYQETKEVIGEKIENIRNNFIEIGFFLKQIRDNKTFEQDGYKSIYDFAQDIYGITRSTASRWMDINDRFSEDGDSPELAAEYKEFGKSQLQEMLYLDDKQLTEVTPEMTVREIKEIRKPEEETALKLKKPDETDREYLNAFAKYFIHVRKEWFKQDFEHRVMQVEESPKQIKQMLGVENRTWYFKINDVVAHIDLFDDYVQIWNEKHEYMGDFDWFYLAAAIQSMWNVVAAEDAQKEVKPKRTCLFDKERDCSIEGAREVAVDIGIECKYHCCHECNEDCGARCNHSAKKRYEEKVIPEAENTGNNIPCDVAQDERLPGQMEIHNYQGICPDQDTSIDELDLSVRTYNCLKRAGIDTIEELKNMQDEELAKIRNFGKYNMDEVHKKLKEYDAAAGECATSHTEEIVIPEEDIAVESGEYVAGEAENVIENDDSVIEEDLLEETTEESDLEIAKETLMKEKRMLRNMQECYTDNDWRVRRQKILVRALEDLTCELEGIDDAEPEPEQPELPVLRNNDMRKEFLETFHDWPVWFEVPEADETYYRYNLPDGSSIVICEYNQYVEWKERYTDENPETTYTREYLLKPGYHYLNDCKTNTTTLIEHLKEVQKK